MRDTRVAKAQSCAWRSGIRHIVERSVRAGTVPEAALRADFRHARTFNRSFAERGIGGCFQAERARTRGSFGVRLLRDPLQFSVLAREWRTLGTKRLHRGVHRHGSVSITKSRKDCAQIVANRDSEIGYAFAIAGCALLLDALLPFVSPAHRGRLLGPQKHQLSSLSLAARALAQPGIHLGRFLGPQELRGSALSLSVKSAVRRIVL